jgi:GNAT superfamily N-acetyltransferase
VERIGPVELRDGTVVRLRPMDDGDGDRLVRFHDRLSADTQYLRFFSGHPHLTAAEVLRFTHVDHRRREAVVAEVEAEAGGSGEAGEIVAVARMDVLDGGREAEVAFVVADELQGRGLGGVLLRWLVARAAELGVERLVAETLLRNRAMLAVFHHAGLPVTSQLETGGVVRVTLTVPPAPGA